MNRYEVAHPFTKTMFEDGTYCWSIGCERGEDSAYGEVFFYAHGEGRKIITEVSRYTPPGYREKVFFTAEYFDPDGVKCGRKKLQMLGAEAFKRRLSGPSIEYEIIE